MTTCRASLTLRHKSQQNAGRATEVPKHDVLKMMGRRTGVTPFTTSSSDCPAPRRISSRELNAKPINIVPLYRACGKTSASRVGHRLPCRASQEEPRLAPQGGAFSLLSRRFAFEHRDLAGELPEFNIVAVNKLLCSFHRLRIVSAFELKRLNKMTV